MYGHIYYINSIYYAINTYARCCNIYGHVGFDFDTVEVDRSEAVHAIGNPVAVGAVGGDFHEVLPSAVGSALVECLLLQSVTGLHVS